ncbi:hypothetical protein O181_075598 [Austropuccinia psidii MF-1]|uniref:Reverse transcriptase domain-containing protein n=1 Tax=Austropuccinia psidii MF-1 TaxID=1389203 RepID=A0A9Q3IC15_9BASI|nr:hypothetical protein [Austropuccinia psidii MF-1]
MDITLELDTSYHERQKENSNHKDKRPEASKSNSSHPQDSSSSNQKKKKNFKEREKPHSSLLNRDFKLINSEKERRIKEVLCTYCGVWDEEEETEEIGTIIKVVPSNYHQFLDVLSKVKAEKIPPHCACDHHIKLEGCLPPLGVIYALSNQESDTLRAYISENSEKGFIQPSSSSPGGTVLFVKKKDGGLLLCVDYCKFNAVTRKNKYPVPPMNQLPTVFNGSSVFSNIDVRGAYNLLRIKEGDEDLTCFRNKYGSYEYFFMTFGLTNALSSFQNLFNEMFYYLHDVCVVVYLDEIMLFSKSE